MRMLTSGSMRAWHVIVCVVLASFGAIAFGGGGERGTGGRMTSYAAITDFGSIWVNGVEFFTNTAAITIDNVPGQPESALKAGMVVKVNGDLAANGLSGVATSVVHNTDLRGTVDAAPTSTADGFAFSVHGLGVRSDSRTIISGVTGVGLLIAGQRISVSGLRDTTNGTLRASRIEVLPAGASGSVLRGVASAVSGTSFKLGTTAVNGATATLLSVTWAEIAAGADVRVRSTTNVTGGALVANSIERGESLVGDLDVGYAAEFEGLAANVTAGQFTLNGITVTTNAATLYENGTAADLVNGAKVVVKGTAITTSSASAAIIRFAASEAIDATANVVSKTATSVTLLSPTNNVVFTVNTATTYKDSSNAKVSNFNFGNIAVGDTLQVRGLVQISGSLATRIERTKPASGFDLKTRVFEAQIGAIVLENAIVSTNAATLYFDGNGAPITQAAFMDRAIGLRIHARGNVSGNVLMATSLELQNSPGGEDSDADGIPDNVELAEGQTIGVKDNAIFTGMHPKSDRWFAMQQYRDFLGREAEVAGRDGWMTILNSGTQTREQVIQSFFNSQEFQNGVPPVVRLYLGYFNRIPDHDGLFGWVSALRAGTPLAAVSGAFAASQEFQLTYGALSDSDFVTLVYRNVLGRAPDTAGFNGWLSQLRAGLTRGEMMTGFTESQEYQTKTQSNVFVIMMYEGMLRRAAEQAGYEGWVNYMNAGNSGLDLTRGFINSLEYRYRFLPQ